MFSKSYKKLYRYIISTPQYLISFKRKFLHSEKLTLCYKGQTSESIICHKKNPVEKKWADQPDLLGHEMFWNKSRKTYHDLPSLILWAQTYSFKVDVKELEVIYVENLFKFNQVEFWLVDLFSKLWWLRTHSRYFFRSLQ